MCTIIEPARGGILLLGCTERNCAGGGEAESHGRHGQQGGAHGTSKQWGKGGVSGTPAVVAVPMASVPVLWRPWRGGVLWRSGGVLVS